MYVRIASTRRIQSSKNALEGEEGDEPIDDIPETYQDDFDPNVIKEDVTSRFPRGRETHDQ